MKKTLIALAALAAVSAASAQSSVTLYGRLDAGYSRTETTTTPAVGASTKTRDNGISSGGLRTSMWGMRGSEDLGGGLKANFKLEQQISMDTGAVVAGFTRAATVGLSGNFGEVKIGRDETPLYSTLVSADVFGAGGARTVNLYPDADRASDMVSYTTPNMGGFSAKVMVGRNDTSVSGVGATTTKGENTGLSGTYAAGPLMVGLAYGKIENTAGVVISETDGAAVVASYDLGVAKLFASHARQEIRPDQALAGNTESDETNLGVAVPMGAITVLASLGRNTKDVTTNAGATTSQSGNDFVLGVTYDLSKRTALYAKAGTYNKLDASTANPATKTTATALGLRHLF